MNRLCIPFLTLLFLAAAAPGLAQGGSEDAEELATYIKANYTKYEYNVPMRDGERLFTAVYLPKDDSRTYGIMLMRTPYDVGPYGTVSAGDRPVIQYPI